MLVLLGSQYEEYNATVFACLKGWLYCADGATLLRFLAALTVFITLFYFCWKVSDLYCFWNIDHLNARHHEKITGQQVSSNLQSIKQTKLAS